jgi:tight adherence protein C
VTLFVYLVVFLLVAVASTMAFHTVLPDFDKLRLSKRFNDDLGAGRKPPSLFTTFRLPILLFEDFASSLELKRKRASWEKGLQALGLEQLVTVDQLIALRFTLVVIFSIYAVVLVNMLPVIFCLFLPVLGWYFMDLWLRDKVRERKRKILGQLPFVLDTLTLSVEAGLEFTAAIARIATQMDPSPLRDELMIFLRQMQLGTSRRDALRNLAARTDVTQVNSMVTALIQASEMGTSIGVALRTQSEIMSAVRFTEAEKKGAEASQKLLIPMMIFIIPAIMLILIGPTFLQYIYGRGL